MGTMLAPFLVYVFVTTFTPGTNNVTSAAVGAREGYRGALKYILGIVTGFATVMLTCGILTSAMTALLPSIEPVLRVLGALYMLWLALEIVRSTWKTDTKAVTGIAFSKGVLLQLINVKVIIYGMTVFSGFLLLFVKGAGQLFLASVFLACVAFLSTSLWAIFGSTIGGLLVQTRSRLVFNVVMALLMVYSAATVAGVSELWRTTGS